MTETLHSVNFSDTALFSKIVLDYINKDEKLTQFYTFYPSSQGLEETKKQKNFSYKDRALLQTYFNEAYNKSVLSPLQKENISAISHSNTYTICAAHQANIFIGPLYVIYKIIQTIKIAAAESQPDKRIIPVFFIGSEDADFEELSSVFVNTEKLQWHTKQRGAFGRLKMEGLDDVFGILQKQLSHLPNSKETLSIIKDVYLSKIDTQTATFFLLNELFKEEGLLIINPDNKKLKTAFKEYIKKDVLKQCSKNPIEESIKKLAVNYKIQAKPRDINFFYLHNHQREKINIENGVFVISNLNKQFSQKEMEEEIENFPERFSPNVFLRALMQEVVLPNIAFVGGGGEIAYWLEMKNFFDFYNVAFPMLIIRNSIVVIDNPTVLQKIKKLKFDLKDFFVSEEIWLNDKAKINTQELMKHSFKQHIIEIKNVYQKISADANVLAPHLKQHVSALEKKHLNNIKTLETKIIRSQKKDFQTSLAQKKQIENEIFPNQVFQERNQSFLFFYAKYGKHFFDEIKSVIKCFDAEIKFLFFSNTKL